jgi:NADH dehydrogenase FAD-containing subunit
VLIISTGVSNGFWRTTELETDADVQAGIESTHAQLAAAASIAVIGGGAAAVSTAWNAARAWPDKQIDLYFPGERALPHHHGKVWARLEQELLDLGVAMHPGYRAAIPDGFFCDAITTGSIHFSTGQPPSEADAIVWAVGRARPNTDWLPAELLDVEGYVRAGLDLVVPGVEGVFAIGDVAATDPLRSSARNFTFNLLAANVRAHLAGKPLKTFTPPTRRWGSIVGYQDDGLVVFSASGQRIRIPRLPVDRFIRSRVVDRQYYKGIRR